MITSADHFNRAVTLWYELTGLDPNAKSWSMGSYHIQSMTDDMIASMEYDPSFITTYLLLDAYSTAYFKDAKVSVHEFDTDPDKIFDYMDKVREFKKLIRDPAITQVADAFTEQVRKALLSYNVEADRIAKFLEDRASLAYIRRDALKSINRLQDHHFLQGEVDPVEVKPVYNREVFGYWNINSLIEHACSMPAGIALNLIRDPDELHSYFAFSIRNGGNMILLTDIEEYAHPLGRYMSRRPDKTMASRIERNWFPYQLLAIKYDKDGNPYHDKYRESQAKGLVPRQPHHFVLEKLANIGLGEIVWTTLMFDLIVEKYWRNPIPVKELSYTNEMIRLTDQNTLLTSAAGSNLPVVGYQPLQLAPLTPADVMTDALDERAIGKRWDGHTERYGANIWMEQRYGPSVPMEALNQIGTNDDSKLFLASKPIEEKITEHHGRTEVALIEGEVLKAVSTRHQFYGETALSHIDTAGARVYGLERVDGTLFGTREQIDADRKFIARFNFSKAIQRAADDEFEAERANVLKWFIERVTERLDFLMAYAHYDEVEKVRRRWGSFTRTYKDEDPEEKKLERYSFATMNDLNRKLESYEYTRTKGDPVVTFDQGHSRTPYFHRCYLTGAKSSFQLAIRPGCPTDLAWMTGVEVKDLPAFLQNWNPGDDAYVGNSILNRIDPLEWNLDNPWDAISFHVSIYLSKRGRAQIIKTLPKPEVADVSHIHNRGITRQNGRAGRSKVHHSNWDTQKYIKEQK